MVTQKGVMVGTELICYQMFEGKVDEKVHMMFGDR